MQEECSFLHKSVSVVLSFSNKVVLLMKIGSFKRCLFRNCDQMLNFVNFKNGGICVHWRVLDAILNVLSNLLMSKLTDTSAYLGM